MEALKYGAVFAVVAGLIIGILLGTAGPGYPAPHGQSYCLDENAVDAEHAADAQYASDAEPLRRPGDQGCRPRPSDQWLDSWENLVPAHEDLDID